MDCYHPIRSITSRRRDEIKAVAGRLCPIIIGEWPTVSRIMKPDISGDIELPI